MNKAGIATITFLWVHAMLFGSAVVAQQEIEESDATKLKRLLQAKLDQIVTEESFPGATLSVVLNDGTALNLAAGYSDPGTEQEMTTDALMLCGSTGKTFVSAVALQLVSEGKLQLDDLAKNYFDGDDEKKWFDKLPNANAITIRSLLNHTSGLPRYLFQEAFLADLKANPLKHRTPTEGLTALHGTTAIHPVGDGWAYSDSNYQVLGLVIEKVTGKTYYENARQRLLDPLGLTQTIPATQPELPGLIPGHIGSVNMFELPLKTVADGKYVLNPAFEWCGGGYITNSVDLARWLQALHSGKVLDTKAYAELVQAVDFRTGQPAEQGYGLGTFVWKTDNGLFLGHAGIMPGYLTQIEFSQDHKFAIAFQTNTDEGMGQRLHKHVQTIAELIIVNEPRR